ncbi:MAG: hypothetical protein Q9181_001676 [Wetmoreana brouardii]
MEQSVAIPPGILSTCLHGSRRRPSSYDAALEHASKDIRSSDHEGRRAVSMFTAHPGQPEEPVPEPDKNSTVDETSDKHAAHVSTDEANGNNEQNTTSGQQPSLPVATDFAQVAQHDNPHVIEGENRHDRITIASIPEQIIEGQHPPNRSSRFFNRVSYTARSFSIVSYRERRSGSSSDVPSLRFSTRLSALFHPRNDSFSVEGHPIGTKRCKRDSKAIPKSWRFLGISASGLGDAVTDVTSKLSTNNWRAMYEKAKVRQEKITRSHVAQVLFRYTFYFFLIAITYLVLVGLPLWRGAVWYMYILFQKHLVLKAGLTITFGIAFLYAYSPLLINFEPTAPLPEVDESGRAEPSNSDTALIIPCYKSEKLIGDTLEAALKIFPKQNIFVVANGNSPQPLDNTAAVCETYNVSHTWSPLGSKIIAQFVGCYVARTFPNVLLIDDDCLLPPNLPIVSDRLRGNVKCIGYIMKSVGPEGSKGSLCQQAQDLEYKLSGLAKAFAGKVGSVTFPHGAIVLWDRGMLVETFQKHPGFSVSEDWFFGHAARQLGSRIMMCTPTFVATETPSSLFRSTGGARGGFGE